MTHFMEEGCDLAMCEERGFVFGWFREVADNCDHGALNFTIEKALAPIPGHPCALFFTCAGEEVSIKCADECAILVSEVEGVDIFMPYFVTLIFFEL